MHHIHARSCRIMCRALVLGIFFKGLFSASITECQQSYTQAFIFSRRTRTHLPTGWFTALHRRSFPEGSLQSSIADRTIGIRLHSNFTVALPDVAASLPAALGDTCSVASLGTSPQLYSTWPQQLTLKRPGRLLACMECPWFWDQLSNSGRLKYQLNRFRQ